jgi:hypothetical protein
MIHCKNNGPDLWGWGAEKETGAVLIQDEREHTTILSPKRKMVFW